MINDNFSAMGRQAIDKAFPTPQGTTEERCKHRFIYSHQEQDPITATTAFRLIDVVVCANCGMVKRSPKMYTQ